MGGPRSSSEAGGDPACWAHLLEDGSLDPEQTLRLAEEGWIVVAGLLTSSAAASLARRCEEVLADDAEAARLRPGDKPVAGTHHLSELEVRVPEVLSAFRDPRLLAAVHALVGPGAHAGGIHYRSPQPGRGGQRLHTDSAPMATVGPAQVATCIVALTDFTERNGATRVVAGSHRRPDVQRAGAGLDSHPEERLLTGAAGTAFVFSGHLLHSGTRNRCTTPRPSLQASWGRDHPGPTR